MGQAGRAACVLKHYLKHTIMENSNISPGIYLDILKINLDVIVILSSKECVIFKASHMSFEI